MNEQELRTGMQELVASSPPPMNPNTALDAGRRAHRRRRAAWAGTGAGLAVVAVAAGVVITLGGQSEGTLPIDVASAPTVLPPTSSGANQPAKPGDPSPPENTKLSWPNGQTDRTARSGPQAEKGVQLHDALAASIPDTLAQSTKTEAKDTRGGGPMPLHMRQAQFEDRVGDKEVWSYTAIVPVVAKDKPNDGTGELLAEVHTPGNTLPTDPCKLAKSFWGVGGTCTVKDVQGKKVGVVTNSADDRIDQTAAYRYDDGTVVYVAQAKSYQISDLPGMAQLPLTVDQLAASTLNPAFKLG